MKVIITRNNRTFEAYVNSSFYNMVEVTFYEVIRPNWKFFRTKFFSFHSTWFYTSDYDNIMTGIEICLAEGFRQEAREQAIQNKWEEFEKSIDKSSKV